VKIYFDTSLLLKSYLLEPSTKKALAILKKQKPPFPLSHLLELELRTAIRVKHGRGEITEKQMRGALQALESDIAAGVLARPSVDLEEVFYRAETLSRKCAATTLARSADIWHLAAALESGCTTLASFDTRQREAAKLCALEVIP